jgi:hypothetical protein
VILSFLRGCVYNLESLVTFDSFDVTYMLALRGSNSKMQKLPGLVEVDLSINSPWV